MYVVDVRSLHLCRLLFQVVYEGHVVYGESVFVWEGFQSGCELFSGYSVVVEEVVYADSPDALEKVASCLSDDGFLECSSIHPSISFLSR